MNRVLAVSAANGRPSCGTEAPQEGHHVGTWKPLVLTDNNCMRAKLPLYKGNFFIENKKRLFIGCACRSA